jgi:hypothetical protein
MRIIIGILIGVLLVGALIWPGWIWGHPVWGPWQTQPSETVWFECKGQWFEIPKPAHGSFYVCENGQPKLVLPIMNMPAQTHALPQPAAEPTAPASQQSDACQNQAVQLGPWAPSSYGNPEDFEIDATNGVVHASLWFPGLSADDTEYSVVLHKVRIRVIGAGTAWQWSGCHNVAFAQADAVAHGQRRQAANKITVLVTLDQLIQMYPNNVIVLPLSPR